ncbi:hypothetical protein D3C87_916350 [compost metagenome]
MGQSIGRLIQPLKTQGLIQVARGQCFGLARDFTIPVLQHQQRRFGVCRERRWRDQRNTVQRCLRRFQQFAEQTEQGRHESFDGLRAIEVAGIGHLTVNQRAVIGDVQRQIEVGAVLVQRILGDSQPWQSHRALFLHADVLVELGLEQRVVAEGAFSHQFVHQLLERQLLMRLRAERSFTHPRQQILETAALIHLATQHLGVDEKADQPFDFSTATVGIRHADTNVALPGLPRQKQREPGQHQHEQTDALATGEGVELQG